MDELRRRVHEQTGEAQCPDASWYTFERCVHRINYEETWHDSAAYGCLYYAVPADPTVI